MKKLVLCLTTVLLASVTFAQCTFLDTQYPFGVVSAPANTGDVTTLSFCNYYQEYGEIGTLLSSVIYEASINDGGYITVFDMSDVAVAWGPSPLSFTPPADGNYQIQWNGAGCITDFNCHETSVTNVGPSSACTNPALGGSATSTVGIACSGQPFTLGLSGASAGTGLTYQWQSSADGITYADMAGATTANYVTTQTAMTYYQCIVTCSAGSTATSASIMIDMGTCVIMGNGTATTCGGTFYDSGAGTGNYQDGENYTMTIYPSTPGSLLQVSFNSFQLETCCDDITVYNGNSTLAPMLGSFATNPGSITSSAADGSLTFVFYSDGSVNYFGWDASLSCVLPPANDSVCNAIAIPVDGTVNTYNNGGAGIEAGESTIAPPTTGYNETDGWGNSTLSYTTWFTFDAPASGNVSINCTDVEFDGQLAIYSATSCSDFSTFTFVAGNDDALDFTSSAPKFTVCGLTPGDTYYLLYDSESTYASGEFTIQISDLFVDAGNTTTTLNTCSGDTVNLFNGISGNDAGGIWYEMTPTVNLTDSLFNSNGLAYQQFDFQYVVVDGCATDTSSASVEIYSPSYAGNDGAMTVCRNQPTDLYSALSGVVDLGGQWYDPSNNTVNSLVTASNIPGLFNYDYITGNGVCPDDTANVLVTVDATCNYLNVEEMYFSNMSMFPNPTNGLVYITNEGSTETFDYVVTDIEGRIIASQSAAINGTSITSINLNGKVTGVYMIRVFNENAEKVFRVVLQ